MIDYTNNFPLPELRPEGGLLQFQAYTTTPAFQASWQGEGSILDRTRLTDPTAWGYEQDKRESISREEYYAATQLMAAEAGTNTGIYGEYIHSALGKDVNKGAVLRSIYFGADPLAAMPFGPSELPQTPEEEKELLDTLNTLTAAEVGLPVDSKNLTPNQKRIKELSDKLLYKKALEETDKNLGVSVSRQIFAQMELLSTLADKLGITDPEESAKLARDTKDIERIRTRIDPGFSPTEWFDRTYSDPIVQQGLLDNGITAQLIASARNQDEAEFRIYRALLQGDLQKRMATYSPTWTDNIRLAGASLVSGFVNSPDVVIDVGEIAGGVTLAVGGVLASPFTGGTSLTGTVGGAAMTATGTTNLFLKLKNIWQANKVLRGSYYAAETVLKLPMGFAPSYAKNLGLLGRTVTPTIMGFSGGALTEYARQQNEMAYAAATLYADPDAVKDYNMSEVAFAGIQSGIVGGALFGLAPNVIGSLAGATMNKLKGVNIAAPGEPVFRNTLDRRFTLKGTTIGDAIDYYGGLLDSKKKAVAVDGPLQETMAAKAELEKKNPTAEEVIKETETRVDRVETKNVETTDRAASIPETPALKRYENESKAGYVRRVAGLKEVSNIYQFVRELARKSPDAADNLRTSTDDWDKMTPMDKIRVLHDAGEHVKNLLDIETKLEGGLAPGREKAIATLETQRKALIRNFSKGLTTDQVKALKKELKGEAVLELPKALAEARNSGATMASRRAAASDLAAKLVEKAEQAAKDKEQAAAIRNSVPQDLLDSFDEMSTEAGLKGAVSEETVQNIKANLVGERVAEPAIQDKFKAAIKKAMLIKRIDEARMEKIRAVINSPHKFVDIVTGNKNNAKRFYDNLLKLNNAGLVSKEDMELVLAAVVHLNFDNKAFAIEYEVAPITDKNGKVLDRIAGEFKPSANKLTINSKFRAIGPSEASTLAMTVLHELGHAFFYHSVKGDAYMDVLKLYNNANSDRFFMTDIRGSDDSLLASGFLDAYHHTNAEETFVETFSKILFTEAEFAVANLDPIKVSMTQLMMDRIMESIALAANMWDSSSHYKAASKIIDKITQVNKLLDDGVSVSKYVTAVQTMLTSGAAQNLTQANRVLEAKLKTNKYNFTKDELDIVNKIGYTDPAFFVAFAINKSQGRLLKTQADFDYVTKAYSRYKATQFSSLLFRVTFGLSLNAKVLKTMTKEQRLAFFELNFFDGLNKSMGVGALSSPARPPTYEDMTLGRLIGNLDETYNATYWLTDGLEYRAVLEEKGLDTTLFDSFDNLKISVLEQLKTFLNEAGLEDMADIAITATQKNFLRKLQKEGIFNVKPPIWSSIESAKTAIAQIISDYKNLKTPDLDVGGLIGILAEQIEPNLFAKFLQDEAAQITKLSPEESVINLLGTVYNAIDKGTLVFNNKTNKWESAKPKKKRKTPAKKEKPVATPEQSKLEATASNSPEVTPDNYKEHVLALTDLYNKTKSLKALRVLSRIIDGSATEIIGEIENGTINTLEKLRQRIEKAGRNVLVDEGRQYRRVKGPDGKIRKVLVESVQTEAGDDKEGIVAGRLEKIDIEGLEKENKQTLIDRIRPLINSVLDDFFTKEENDLIEAFKAGDYTNEGAGKILGVSGETARLRYNAFKKRLESLMVEADLDAKALADPIMRQEQLLAWKKRQDSTVAESKKGKPSIKKIVSTLKEPVAAPSESTVKMGERILAVKAKMNKADTTRGTSEKVSVPTNTTTSAMARVTTSLTNNEAEPVLRSNDQADNLLAGETTATKEAVVFTPKNPLKVVYNNFSELEVAPEKLKKLTELAKKTGYDSLVFRDGSVLPLEETKTVGVVEINTPVGLNTVVTVTKEKGVPVKKITNVEKPPTTHPGDGAPVTLNKNGEPKRAAPEQKKSDLVEETEAANLERKINEDREALRASGLDTNSLKKFLSFYWKKMKEIDKEGGSYTTLFKKMWNKFVVINSEIYEANLKLVGEDGIKAFWKKVDDLRAQDKHKLATVPGYKARTDASVFAEAARSVNENFIPFITPNELTIKKIGDDYVFSSNVKRVKSIVAANKEEPPVPTPPVIEKPAETAEVKEVKLPEQDKDEAMERETLLEQGINKADQASSTPLRLTNLIGIVFGGSNRESANWWRRLMNWARNSSQAASQTGKTIQSLQRKVRFVSRLFDDTRAQTGHLVAAGKSAFRTAMQCASDEGRIIARISKYQMRLYRNLNNMPDQRRNLMLTVWRRLSEGADISAADVRAAGIPSSMVNQTVSQANDLLVIVRQVNRQLLELEAETGLVNTVDAMGNPVDPQRWATVQLDHEKLSRLSPQERALLIDKLVSARINRKLSNEMLDINTLIVLGWLDVAPSRQNRGTALLAGNREFRAGTAINSFDRATLANLDTGIVYPIGIDPQKILADLANRGQPNRFFVLESNNTLKVYELPRKVSQLSDADKAKYFNAIRGDTSVYTPRWRDYITRSGARNLVELEMKETLDFKTKRGRYSKFNSEMSSNLDRPLMPIGTDEETSLAVPGLIPEEVLAFKEITDVMRTNLAESYFHFLKGRMFALLFQRELDRLLGTTGITIMDVLDYVRRSSEEDLKNLQRSEGWTSQQFEQRLNELNIGMSRIREEYASHADTLPILFNPEMYASRASMAYLKMKVAVGYGISALPETIMEYIKTNPLRIPGEIIKSLRYVLGDLRFSKSALLEEDSGTLLYMLENFRHEHSSRFLGEVAHGSFELDSKLRTKFINSTQSLGAADTGVRGLEVGARVAESIGSLQAITNFVRGMGVRRWQARIWKHISKGRIQKLLTALEDPNMAQLMERIYRAAETDPVEERKLWKQFAAEARKSGFGFDPHEAMVFMRYGLNTKEKIRHLEYLIRQAGGTRRGLVNIDRMADVYWRHRNNPQQGIDNRLLEEVLSSYAFMLNDIVIRTTSPEPVGLGRITNIEAKTQFGRLWYALTSWIRGFQDSVILNYATTSTLKFVASNIILLGTVDTLIGMFKEWIAGRETEDILDEYEENPEAFAIRVMRAAPIMGILNGYLELALSGINSLSGGTWRSYNNPMSSIGIGAASSATRDITTGVADASSQITGLLTGEEEFEPAKLAAAGGKILPYNSLFNRSPIAVPARFVEDMGYLDQRGAVQQYLDLIQREPYPYAKSKRRATRGSDVLTMPPAPRNIAKEMAEYKQLETERPKINEGLKEVIKQQVVNDQKGVSGKLGELLK